MEVQYLIQCNKTKEYFCGFSYRDEPQTIPVIFGANEWISKDEANKFVKDNCLDCFSVVARSTIVSIHNMSELPDLKPHQERVVFEKHDLDGKIKSLSDFIDSDLFQKILGVEQQQLKEQLSTMKQYSKILSDRIKNFN